jgi:hypothetical protein
MTTRRERRRSVRVALVVVASVGVLLAGCSDDDGSSASTTVTVDPLAATVVDGCGNDLSGLTSMVWAIEPSTGAVVWTASVPLADGFLLRDETGHVRVPLVERSVNVRLDAESGEVIDYPEAGVHEVLVDVTGAATGVEGMHMVDGEQRPDRVAVGGLLVETTTEGGALAARGLAPATGAAVWTSPLRGGVDGGETGPPVVYGDLVVVVGAAQTVPGCY